MKLIDTFKLSFMNVTRGKSRNIITILSIIIGISSYMLVSSVGNIGEYLVKKELDNLGLKGISIYKNKDVASDPIYAMDAERLERRFSDIEIALPVVLDAGKIKVHHTNNDAVIFGVGERANEVYNVKLLHGRVPSAGDIRSKNNVVVIDDSFALKNFKRTNVIGKELSLQLNNSKTNVRIIGVIKTQKDIFNAFLGDNTPDFIYIPYTTLNAMRNKSELSQITLKCTENYQKDGREFANYLNKAKNSPNGYLAENISSQMEEIGYISSLISTFVSALASIALIVAGLCITNSSYSAVSERRREIGVFIAVGANFKDIMLLFLTESVIISILGGTIGAIVGLLLSWPVFSLLGIEYMLSFKSLATAELMSFLCGALFSIIPAIKAAKTEPISALRED